MAAAPIRKPQRLVDGPTVREQLARGPHFDPEEGICLGCGGFGQCSEPKVDKSTGLGEACWRAWRWSAIRETQTPPHVETVR